MTAEYDFSGRTLNQRYVLKRQIGAGSFATVYLAEDLRMYKRKVAIKVLSPERRLNPSNVERFIQEVKVAAKLDGPYRDRVVRIIDQGRCDVAQPPLLYLVMEHVEGVTLQALLRPRGSDQPRQPLPWTQAVSIIRELLKALGTLHGCGVVHRDIKPGNCILEQRPDGDFLKLLDLGIVKVMPGFEMTGDHPRTHPEFVLGTPRYMAPEQFGGPCSDPSIDLYAAGIMLYEFLTGDVPARWYEQKGAAHPYEPLPPSQINTIGAIPPTLDAIVLRSIAFEPAKRFPSAVAFAGALSEVLLATTTLRDEPPTEPRVATVAATAAPVVQVVAAVEPADPVGSLLRWWTIASTTCTAMVFVFAFASVLRRAESRPALDLESDEAPAVAESAARRPGARPAASSRPPATAPALPTPAAGTVAAAPDSAVDGSGAADTAASPPAAEASGGAPPAGSPTSPPQPNEPQASPPQPDDAQPDAPAPDAPPSDASPSDAPVPDAPRPKKPRAPTPKDDPGVLLPVWPKSIEKVTEAAQNELRRRCNPEGPQLKLPVVVFVRPKERTLGRIDLPLTIDEGLRECVLGRASSAFQFRGLDPLAPKYRLTLTL